MWHYLLRKLSQCWPLMVGQSLHLHWSLDRFLTYLPKKLPLASLCGASLLLLHYLGLRLGSCGLYACFQWRLNCFESSSSSFICTKMAQEFASSHRQCNRNNQLINRNQHWPCSPLSQKLDCRVLPVREGRQEYERLPVSYHKGTFLVTYCACSAGQIQYYRTQWTVSVPMFWAKIFITFRTAKESLTLWYVQPQSVPIP